MFKEFEYGSFVIYFSFVICLSEFVTIASCFAT